MFMKVVTISKYGSPDVLKIEEVTEPKINQNEILVRIIATSVTAADSRIRAARFPKGFGLFARLVFGVTKPRIHILGSTYSGVIEKVGKNVSGYKVGDEICGMTGTKMGTYAERIKVSKFNSIAKKPKSISHQDAVGMLFGGTAALYFVRNKLKVKKGDTVLVNGASGAVGTNAVQLAKYFGAEVTGVTSSDNANIVRKLGAKHVIDYEKQNILELRQKFDVVLDTVGNISPEDAKKLIKTNGRAGLMVAGLSDALRAHGQVIVGTATEKSEDITFLLSLMEQRKLKTVIDSTFKLKDITKAHRRADSGRKVGNIVIEL